LIDTKPVITKAAKRLKKSQNNVSSITLTHTYETFSDSLQLLLFTGFVSIKIASLVAHHIDCIVFSLEIPILYYFDRPISFLMGAHIL